MTRITASNIFQYSDAPFSPRVIVRFEPVLAYNPEVIKIRVYPWNPDQIVASGGTIRQAGNAALDVRAEIVTFNRTDTAIPELPITGGFSWRSLNAIYDLSGNPIPTPNFSADPDLGVVRCDQAVFGVIEIDYQAGYTVADYIPNEDFKTLDLAAVWVAAIKGDSIGQLQITTDVFSELLDYVELYTVTSTVVIDVNGRWELPNDWPDNPNYNPLNTQPPDPDESATEDRTHDRGVIDNRGRLQFDRPFIRYERPFIGDPNYTPKWRYTQGSPPPGYETAFQDFDFGELKKELAARYPGLEGV